MSQRCVFIIGHVVVRIAKKGSETILHRGVLQKAQNIRKKKKFTKNANSQKAVAIH